MGKIFNLVPILPDNNIKQIFESYLHNLSFFVEKVSVWYRPLQKFNSRDDFRWNDRIIFSIFIKVENSEIIRYLYVNKVYVGFDEYFNIKYIDSNFHLYNENYLF